MFTISEILLSCPVLLFFGVTINCDNSAFFTSVETMEELFEIELDLLESLNRYIRQQDLTVNLLKSRYEQSVKALSNVRNKETYVSNPINAFSLIKRLTKEWPKTLSLIPNTSVILGENELPGRDDFLGAVKAIFRLQDVYQFSAETLAKGNLSGVDKYSIMTAEDCAELAYYYFSLHYYNSSTQWLLQALNKVDEDKSLKKGYLLEAIALSTCFEGEQKTSSNYVEQLLTAYPEYTPPAYLVKDFNVILLKKCSEIAAEKLKHREPSVPELFPEEIEQYNSMCRKKIPVVPSGELLCYYVHYNKIHLRIGPFKMEELHIDPPILLFHDVMSDEEISHLKKESGPYMLRAEIIMPNGSIQANDYRTSRAAWVEDDYDEVARRISLRVKEITNIDIKHSEMNQISNYGIAGEYILHTDAIGSVTDDPTGNRLATFMFYMTDVQQGGHTVFPLLGVSIAPKKGAGVFWFNLHKNGIVDSRTRHASCPVVLGSKWVCNKWLHEAGNELRFPCCSKNSSRSYFYL